MKTNTQIQVMVMSGVEDGTLHTFAPERDGLPKDERWILTIGRREDNDLCLRNDTFISRQHANILWYQNAWWLEDLNSTNGTFVESTRDFFSDERVLERIPLTVWQLFRIGRTWLRLQPIE